MDLNWCLVCEKHTSRGAYCSELCRRVDVARSLRTPDASPAAPASRPPHSHVPTLHLSPFPSTNTPTSFPSPPVTPTTSLYPSRKSSFTLASNTPMPSPRVSPCMGPNHASSTCGSTSLAIPVLTLGSAAIPMVHHSSLSHSGSKSMASSPAQQLSTSDLLSKNQAAFMAPLLLR